VDPISDLLPDKKLFPAFVFVQFQITDGRLDTTAYFRKQEMPHWWPINVGELAHLQSEVVDALAVLGKAIPPGSITTVTALPVIGGSVPRVAVPDLDIRADSSTGMLNLVLPLFDLARPSAEVVGHWHEAFSDWTPGERAPADGDSIPLYGLQELLAVLDATISITQVTGSIAKLRSEIHVLRTECQSYDGKNEKDRRAARNEWRSTTMDHMNSIDGLVSDIVTARAH
jgi:hypothetical protein